MSSHKWVEFMADCGAKLWCIPITLGPTIHPNTQTPKQHNFITVIYQQQQQQQKSQTGKQGQAGWAGLVRNYRHIYLNSMLWL